MAFRSALLLTLAIGSVGVSGPVMATNSSTSSAMKWPSLLPMPPARSPTS